MTDPLTILTSESQGPNHVTGTAWARNSCIMWLEKKQLVCGAPVNDSGYFCNRHDDRITKEIRRRNPIKLPPTNLVIDPDEQYGYDPHGMYKVVTSSEFHDSIIYVYVLGGDALTEQKKHVGRLRLKQQISDSFSPDQIASLKQQWLRTSWNDKVTHLVTTAIINNGVVCRDNCWEAAGNVCICSCGGHNHSIALNPFRVDEYKQLWSDLHASR